MRQTRQPDESLNDAIIRINATVTRELVVSWYWHCIQTQLVGCPQVIE
jgi:hypothetical protein